MIVLDASVWTSTLLQGDAHNAQSVAWMTNWVLSEASAIVPGIFLPEVVSAITRRTANPDFGRLALESITSNPIFEFHYEDEGLTLLSAEIALKLGLRGPDCLYVALAAQLRMPLITWDEEMLARSQPLITCLRPSEI